jgi:hypothetical protein
MNAVAELAYFDVEEEEEAFGDEKAACPAEHWSELEVDGADVDTGWAEDGE